MADKRVERLETEVAELRRLLGTFPKPGAISFPRERWLGKTVERTSSYPTPGNGDTFEVELLSAAFSPHSPGATAIASRARGPVVIARTWPAQYLPVGSYVIVDHIKGNGPGGEWWIAGGGAQAEVIRWANLRYDYYASAGLSVSGANWTTELLTTNADGTAAGNAGHFAGGRLFIDIPGIYHVIAKATVETPLEYLSGGGFRATDWQLYLWALSELTDTGVQGWTQGKAAGIDAKTTVTATGTVRINSPGVVPFFLNGTSYNPPTAQSVKQWELFLLKVAEA